MDFQVSEVIILRTADNTMAEQKLPKSISILIKTSLCIRLKIVPLLKLYFKDIKIIMYFRFLTN